MAVYRVFRPPTRVELATSMVPVLVLAERFAQLQRLVGRDAADDAAAAADDAIDQFRRVLLRLEPILREREESLRGP